MMGNNNTIIILSSYEKRTVFKWQKEYIKI
jgi:hypothetical protein